MSVLLEPVAPSPSRSSDLGTLLQALIQEQIAMPSLGSFHPQIQPVSHTFPALAGSLLVLPGMPFLQHYNNLKVFELRLNGNLSDEIHSFVSILTILQTY